MSLRQAICIVIDGLRASALGTYGNTTSGTPRLDKLASRSHVVEWFWGDSPDLAAFYDAVWSGQHTLREKASRSAPSVLDILGEAGVERRLMTDDTDLAEQPTPGRFDKVVRVVTSVECAAEDLSETAVGQFCSAAIERLEGWQEESPGGLTWLHTRGLFGLWDAPLDLRAELLDEDDPPAATFLNPPSDLRHVDDPDVLLVHRAAYAAQVAVVDACVGALCQAIEESATGTETLLILLGSRGFALGEHGAIGGECRELYGERLHLPCLVHVCGERIPRSRLAVLAQPVDLRATLLNWFGVGGREDAGDGRALLVRGAARQVAVSAGDSGERAIRTPAWFLRQTGTGEQLQLFVKPDDRWEANDVATRCPQVVEKLGKVLAEFERCCREGLPLPDSALDEDLVNPSR